MTKRKLIASILGILNFIIVTLVVLSFYFWGGGANMEVYGSDLFVFFTNDSNVLAAISTLVFAIFLFLGKENQKWIDVLRLMGASSISLTFTVVVLYLGPLMTYKLLYDGIGFWTHLICPCLTVATFLLVSDFTTKSLPYALLGVVPTILYGAVYLTEVVIIGKENGGWTDFYSFTLGGLWPLYLVVLLSISFGLSVLLLFCQRKLKEKRDLKEQSNG